MDDERPRKTVRRLAPGGVELAALDYLRRYSVSTTRLRLYLRDKAARSCAAHGDPLPTLLDEIEQVIVSLSARRILDDDRYAEARIQALADRGVAPALVAQRIRNEGVSGARVEAAMARSLADAGVDRATAALAATVSAARRRRLGPFRLDLDTRVAHREKDCASLLRAGHAWRDVRPVVDADDGHALLVQVGLVR